MKNLLLFALLLTGLSGFAQCNLNLSLTSSLTEYLDSTNVVQRSVDEKSNIEISKTQVLISPEGKDTMTGKITSATCNWTTPYKTGKSIIKADFEDPNGSVFHATITLEGKDDKVMLTMVADEMVNRKIRVTIDSFKEKN